MKQITISALFILLFSSAANLFAQMVTQQWSALYDNPGTYTTINQTLVDNNGNVYTAGEKTGSSFTTIPYLVKYNSAGTFQFQRTINAAYYGNPNFRGARFKDMTFDNTGNIVVCGYLDSAYGYIKGFITKFNQSGDSLWGVYSGINDTLGYCAWNCMTMDNSGNIYVAGVNFVLDPSFASYFLTAKFSPSGSLLWAKRSRTAAFYSYSVNYVSKIFLDNSGNILVGTTVQKTVSSASLDYVVYKLNSSGTFQWASTYNGPADGADIITSAGIDPNGDILLFGNSQNVSPLNTELACVKFSNSTGSQLWAYRTSGTGTNGSDDAASKLSIGTTGDIYLSGTLYNLNTSQDGALIKLSSSGTEQWRRTTNTANDEYYFDVKTQGNYVYVTGGINPYSINGTVVTKAYNISGDSLWGVTFHTANHSQFSKNIALTDGALTLTGDENNSPNGDMFVIRYGHTTGIQTISSNMPENYSLKQNYPNPFNPSTNIEFSIPKSGSVTMKLYDILGKEVSVLVNEIKQAGVYRIDLNASNLASGIYFYKLDVNNFSEKRKMVLIK